MVNLLLYFIIFLEFFLFGLMFIKMIRQKEISDIRTTGYFGPAILVNFGLYLIAVFGLNCGTSESGLVNFCDCVMHAVSACLLNIETEIIDPAIAMNDVFGFAFILCYALNLFTIIFVVVGLTGRYLLNAIKVKFILHKKQQKFIIFGYSDDAIAFSKTIPSRNIIFWVNDINKATKKELLSKKFMNLYFEDINATSIQKLSKYRSRITFISFVNDNAKILKLINAYTKVDNKMFNLYVSLENQFEDAFKFNFGNKNITFFNKFSLISKKFISDHPITSYLNSNQIDYSTATVKNNVDINVLFIGYGNTNKNILHNMVIDNQLPTIINSKPALKTINYHIFDRNEFLDKNFNANIGRYYQDSLDASLYYDLPERPLDMQYHDVDVYHEQFFKKLDYILANTDPDNSLNYCVVSFGSDLENIDEIIRLKQYFTQKDLDDNMQYFCRITNATYVQVLEKLGIHPFGEYAIMNYETIIGEKLNKLSLERNFQKELKRPDVIESYEQINKIRSIKKRQKELDTLKLHLWNSLDHYTRDFDSFSSINIRTKLNLIGLDTIGNIEVSNKEYFAIYDTLNEMNIVNRTKIYTFPYPDTISPRSMLAYQELLHSNAFWFLKGFVPMPKQTIDNSDNLMINIDYNKKQIATLTTFKGLDKIIKNKLRTRDKLKLRTPNEDLDLKKPLYQVMDNTPLYKYTTYRIYKKEDKVNHTNITE